MPPTDLIERAKIAIVAVINSSPDIQAITGRADNNVTAWNADMTAVLPVIAYRMPVATPGGGAIGDTRELVITFSAFAPTESVCNALLEVLETIRWAPALAALSQPLDAYFRNPVRRDIPWDETEDSYRVDLEMTLTATK